MNSTHSGKGETPSLPVVFEDVVEALKTCVPEGLNLYEVKVNLRSYFCFARGQVDARRLVAENVVSLGKKITKDDRIDLLTAALNQVDVGDSE